MAIRRNIASLSETERRRYVDGVLEMKRRGLYDVYVNDHASSALHAGPAFYPWHREFILRFERDLQLVLNDPDYGLPYWDWAADATLADPTQAPVLNVNFMGPNGVPNADATRDGEVVEGPFGTRAGVNDEAFLKRLTLASERSAITTTVCTGSALLARTGRLDGRPATSNKIAWDWVVQQGPHVLWKRKARWVDDGNVLTSSGVSAGIDMALSLIARLHGRDMALTSARNMEYVWREGAEDDPFA